MWSGMNLDDIPPEERDRFIEGLYRLIADVEEIVVDNASGIPGAMRWRPEDGEAWKP